MRKIEITFTFILLAILPALCTITFPACQKQEAGWQGTIEEVDGVIVVKNLKAPMLGEDVFSLEEELSIGEAEEREEYIFSEIRDIAVDEESRIYVLDSKESHIRVFNTNGEYIKTIGKKGKLYTIEEDEGGCQVVKRYKVTWEM
jgi:hypothetical protein